MRFENSGDPGQIEGQVFCPWNIKDRRAAEEPEPASGTQRRICRTDDTLDKRRIGRAIIRVAGRIDDDVEPLHRPGERDLIVE